MNFVSLEFFVLFGLAYAAVRVLPHRGQNLVLLLASYVFYGWWDWRLLPLLIFSSSIDYAAGLFIAAARRRGAERQARWILIGSLASNLAILGLFKYMDFFIGTVNATLTFAGHSLQFPLWHLILPIGISFYTFQSMSYTIDVYRRDLEPTANFLDYQLYVSFFPQLVAGPIERGTNLLPQVQARRTMSAAAFYSGLQLIVIGFFKKVVVADNLAPVVDGVYAAKDPTGGAVLLATYAFAFQIYADFSGYTDIARGTARTLGFSLMENFRRPFFATGPRDHWQRWHISLSTWFRDYLFVPLGGNRGGIGRGRRVARAEPRSAQDPRSRADDDRGLGESRQQSSTRRRRRGHADPRRVAALGITMVLAGLWHGAAFTFLIWGAFHAVLLVGEHLFAPRAFTPRKSGRWPLLRHFVLAVVFFHVVCVGYLIFRAPSLDQLGTLAGALTTMENWTNLAAVNVRLVAAGAAAMLLWDALTALRVSAPAWHAAPRWAQLAAIALMMNVIVFLSPESVGAFIYFQF